MKSNVFRFLYNKKLFDNYALHEYLIKVKFSCKTSEQKYYYNEWLMNLSKTKAISYSISNLLLFTTIGRKL